MRRVLTALACIALLAGAAPVKLMPGSPVPQLSRTDITGKTVDLAAYRGKLVLIDFWASWCPPCIVAIPHLITTQKTYGARGLQVVGISMDDSMAPVQDVAKRFAFNYPVLLGDAKLGSRFGGVLGLPVQILVGRDGKIIHIWTGEIPPIQVTKAVAEALAH